MVRICMYKNSKNGRIELEEECNIVDLKKRLTILVDALRVGIHGMEPGDIDP